VATAVTAGWIVTVGLGAATVAIRALGPVLLGRRQLPPRVVSVLPLLAPALLAALVVTQVFAAGRALTVDARAAGLLAAAVALLLRAPTLVVIAAAAAAAAAVRSLA
jgi:branched-subunit amino acid transport protein